MKVVVPPKKASPEATAVATQLIAKDFPALPHDFFCRPPEVVAPELIACLLVKRQTDGSLLWGVVVETEAYSKDDPATLGYRRSTPAAKPFLARQGVFTSMWARASVIAIGSEVLTSCFFGGG